MYWNSLTKPMYVRNKMTKRSRHRHTHTHIRKTYAQDNKQTFTASHYPYTCPLFVCKSIPHLWINRLDSISKQTMSSLLFAYYSRRTLIILFYRNFWTKDMHVKTIRNEYTAINWLTPLRMNWSKWTRIEGKPQRELHI